MRAATALAAGFVAMGLHAAETCPAPAPAGPPAAVRPSTLRVGVALGSGSMHGLAHIGVLEEIEAQGLEVKVVSGTSVGWEAHARPSWISLLAGGPDIEEMLAPHFAGRPIEAWPRRFGAVATNLANGHRRVFMSGDGALAVHASSAMPVREPVAIGKEKFGDGAFVEPVPVETARALAPISSSPWTSLTVPTRNRRAASAPTASRRCTSW